MRKLVWVIIAFHHYNTGVLYQTREYRAGAGLCELQTRKLQILPTKIPINSKSIVLL
jgi:hypothetical protein